MLYNCSNIRKSIRTDTRRIESTWTWTDGAGETRTKFDLGLDSNSRVRISVVSDYIRFEPIGELMVE